MLADLQPSGKYLMEDFHYAGGVPAVMNLIADELHGDALTMTGEAKSAQFDGAQVYNDDVITSPAAPAKAVSGTWVLHGNLAPNGAIVKPNAASDELLSHTGKAVVFENIEDYKARIDDPDLNVNEDSILVLKGCGPKGYPGMPEVGNMALPQKLLAKGVRDMVRVSDARMSGTAFGTVILHVSPEADAGGPLAIVQDGDTIEFDGPNRSQSLQISDEDIASRLANLDRELTADKYTRGYAKLYIDHVQQAHEGADLDFLVGSSGSEVERESH